MKVCQALSVASLILLGSVSAAAQDAVKVDPTHYKVLFENASVRVLRIHYAPGEKSAMHQHPDSIVVPLAASKVRFHMAGGKSEDANMASESALYTPAGTHMPENVGSNAIEAVLVEFKSAKPGTAALPSSRDNMTMKLLADSPRAVAHRTTAAPSFQEPAGSKHDYDQVVIALSSAPMSLAIGGQPPKTAWARGEVQFIGRGVAHEAKNTGGKPIDFVIVSIK